MKKLFLSMAVVLATVFAASCSNDDAENSSVTKTENRKAEQKKEKELLELKERIAHMNQEWVQRAPAMETRSTSRWKIVGKAVIAGAKIGRRLGSWGAVIVGAAASAYAIYKTQPKHVALPPTAEPYEKATIVRVSQTGATGPTDSVGYYHNKLLASIGIDKIVAANYADIERLVVDAANKLGIAGKQQVQAGLLYGNADLQFLKNNMGRLNNAASSAEYCTMLRGNLKTVDDAEIGVLEEYMTGLDAIEAARRLEYTRATVGLISESNLPDDVKNSLAGSVIVGNASANLWQTVYGGH